MAAATPEPMNTIEVFADVCCPFTHVGLRRFAARRDELGRHDVVLHVRAWPLELVNGEPIGADLVAEEIEALREQVAPELFTGFTPSTFPSTSVPAFELAAAAYRISGAKGEAASLALRDALFEHGRDISDHNTLAAIAATLELDLNDASRVSTVESDLAEGRQRGVIGSPHFFVGASDFFCPSLDIKRVDGHLHIDLAAERLDSFMDRCLG
jgi:predicted DsbA family dithiol-disulfide isomerase